MKLITNMVGAAVTCVVYAIILAYKKWSQCPKN